jgi:hypothetical protein
MSKMRDLFWPTDEQMDRLRPFLSAVALATTVIFRL